ncbi:MAG: acyl-CoA dehydrogenase family protein [Halioglobus sp.]
MEFGLSEEQILLQDSVNRYLTEQVPLDRVRGIAAGEEPDSAVWAELTELGIPALLVPEHLGGVGLGLLDAVVVAEVLGRHVTPAPFSTTAVMAALPLIDAGMEEELASIATGELRIGIAFGETIGARADAGITTNGDTLSGKCLFALDGFADCYLVAAADKSIYLVRADASGVTRNTLTTIDKTRTTCELLFDSAQAKQVSSDSTVYERALDAGRLMQAADTLGAAQAMLDRAVDYSLQREQFNRVIGSFQAVKHLCADMAADLEPCRSLVWYAGHAMDAVPEEATLLACHAKAHLSEVGQTIAKTATEVHGGMGFTDLLGLHYWFKRIGANRQLLGSPEQVREHAARIQGLI